MKLSIVVPTKDYEDGLVRCLESLRKQTYKNFEIIVVGTEEKTRKTAKKFGGRFVLDKKKTIGNSYYMGAEDASGDIVVFIDDDCTAPEDWLDLIVKEFRADKKLDVLGGEDFADPFSSSYFQNALFQIDAARIMKESVYGRPARNRLRACNIAYKKTVFKKEKFDKNLISLQEPELHQRLYRNGAKMKFNPKIVVYHERRKNLKGVFRQMYRNGRAKISVIKMQPDMTSIYDVIIPAVLLVSLVSMIFILLYRTYMPIVWFAFFAMYFILKPLSILAKTGNFRYYFTLFKIILIREIAYGAGLISRIFRLG